MPSFGRCTNVERCAKAGSQEFIDLYPGIGEVCPECGRRLVPVENVAAAGSTLSSAAPYLEAQAGGVPAQRAETAVAEPVSLPRSTITGTAPAVHEIPVRGPQSGSALPPSYAAPPAAQPPPVEPPPVPPPAAQETSFASPDVQPPPIQPPLVSAGRTEDGDAQVTIPSQAAPPVPQAGASAAATTAAQTGQAREPAEAVQPAISSLPAKAPPLSGRTLIWLGVILALAALALAAFFVNRGNGRLAGGAIGVPVSFRICASDSVNDRLAGSLIKGFFAKLGTNALDRSQAGGTTTFSGQTAARPALTRIGVESSSAARAFSSVTSGSCQIAIVGQAMPSAQRTGSRVPLLENTIGMNAAVVIVNPRNPVTALRLDAVRAIFTGRATNWSPLGGPALPIEVIAPADTTDEMAVFKTHVLRGSPLAVTTRHVSSLGEVADRVGHDANAVGLVSFSASDPGRIVHLIGNDGQAISASALSIGQRRYPLTTPVYLYDGSQQADPLAGQFVNFVQSDAGQQILANANYVTRSSF